MYAFQQLCRLVQKFTPVLLSPKRRVSRPSCSVPICSKYRIVQFIVPRFIEIFNHRLRLVLTAFGQISDHGGYNMYGVIRLPLTDTCKCIHINIGQLLAKLRNADEDCSVVAPVGPVLRFPDGGLLYVVREVQELPQEPRFCLISKPSGGKCPSLSPSPRGSCCSFSFHCLP